MFILGGLALFALIYYSPAWPDAIDPKGEHFVLSTQAKGALAVFAVAATWWIFEVVPIGVTSLLIGTLQALFLIRKPAVAFKDYMDPSVLFIFGSVVIGMVFTKTGLTRRIAYKMLSIIGEKTSMIMLGCFVMTALLTHVMAHTAVAATMFPLLMAIYSLYTTDKTPTRFGKALFIGMAYVAGAGSIITLLGAARGAVALAFYKDMMHVDISFGTLTYYMFPLGWLMVFLLWGFFMIFCKPEKARIVGLKEKASRMYRELGGITRNEVLAAAIILLAVLVIALKSFVPALDKLDKTGILLCSTIAFFVFNILKIDDLEDIPANSQRADDLDRINAAGRHLLALVNDVLDLSRIESNREEVVIEAVDVGQLVRDVMATAAPLVSKKDNRLVLKMAGEPGIIGADALKLRQCLRSATEANGSMTPTVDSTSKSCT